MRFRFPTVRAAGRYELGTLLSVLALTVGLWAFAAVLTEVYVGDTAALDRALLLALRESDDLANPIGPVWLEEVGRDLTALGGIAVLTLVCAFSLGYLLLIRKPRAAAYLAASVLSALGVTLALKALLDRARPELVPHLSHVMTASFPSGHAMLSAAVYLTLGALLARTHESLLLKGYFLLCAAGVSLVVGVSRVYVGVHWPTDVLAGWAGGAVWASGCWLGARVLQRRGDVERAAAQKATDPARPSGGIGAAHGIAQRQ